MYCPQCGTDHHPGEADLAGGESDAVKIARIEADASVKLAQLARSADRAEAEAEVAVAEVYAESAAEVAAAEAEVTATILGAEIGGGDPDPEPPEAAPIVINDDDAAEPSDLPPASERDKPAEPPEPRKARGFF